MIHTPHPQPTHPRGLTLVELTLAIVVGSLVLLGISGVFAATRNMDRIFGDQYNSSTQLHITQMTIRKALLSLQISQDQRAIPGVDEESAREVFDEPIDRSRIILQTDPVYQSMQGNWIPQRFEVVLSTPPIALNMATKAAAWARINDRDEDSLNFSSTDASGGVMRSVFELRPDNSRERIMRRVGIMDPDPKADEQLRLVSNAPTPTPTGWTLWWRPILNTESNFLRAGGIPLGDSAGTEDEIRFRLAGAIPLIKDIQRCSWTIYKSDVKVNEYEALSMSDLPAYAEFEILLNTGQYASWMFEVDWTVGDDPLDLTEDNDGNNNGNNAGNNNEDNNDNNGGGGNNPNDPSPPGDGGGVIIPGSNSNNNMGGGDT